MRGAQSKTGTCRIFLRGHIELQSVPCTQKNGLFQKTFHHVQARRGNVLSNHGFRLQLLRLTRAAGGVLATEVRRQERECLGSCPG